MNDDLDALLRLLASAPDSAGHPAVYALAARGIAVLPQVLPLLDAPGTHTRRHAQRVFEIATLAWVRAGMNAPALRAEALEIWRELWFANGGYDARAGAPARRAAQAKWRAWLCKRSQTG